jgi:hypothetical protein
MHGRICAIDFRFAALIVVLTANGEGSDVRGYASIPPLHESNGGFVP